jgi:hypothetical protein
LLQNSTRQNGFEDSGGQEFEAVMKVSNRILRAEPIA